MIFKLNGNVVGHVPREMHPHVIEGRSEFRNPVRKLDHFKILAFHLQIIHARPQRIRDQSAKPAERHRGKRQQWRRIFEMSRPGQSAFIAKSIQSALYL
jgi:hypothetical protein